jgi:hypothetical protein|tara:strand:+ start:21747 stop:23585 length:1839 start_codon:yes stop_codon:yes gene_type:complete
MANRKISYTERDFEGLRQDLINFTRQYYPELIDNFNDASVFSVFLDLNAAIGDNLNYHIDRSIQETVLQYAQQKSSIYNIARTYGLKIPGNRPSIALLDVSITVPAFGDQEDSRYLGVIRSGSQFIGAGQIFENQDNIDFSTQYNNSGFPNRTKIPNFDSNNRIVNYTITKREVVVNGATKIFKKTINNNDVKPFYEFFLPEKNVISITTLIQKDGTSYSSPPTYGEFITSPDKWYEVDALAENTIFIEDQTKASDKPGIKVGRYIETENRFISEYTPEGYCKLTFGSATVTADDQLAQFARTGIPLRLENYQNNISLGKTVKANTTLFVKYRIGGGVGSNVGVNVITQIGVSNFAVTGPSPNINQNVIQSLRCNNITAAIGGGNLPTTEEVRNMVTYNFAAQKRAVTVNDYNSLIRTMPSKFGAPAKAAITEEDNKINIQILSYDNSGNLTSNVSNTLKQNIANYLSNYRMINDYISVKSAQVVDLEFDFSIAMESSENQGQVITNVVDSVNSYMSPATNLLGKNVNVSDIRRIIQDIPGVSTLAEIKIFNKTGGQYSSSETSQRYVDNNTKQIELIDDTIFAQPNQIYQVRFPDKDIKVRIKLLKNVDFS